ncbi:MAG: RnfABCDGE type electron transport complex subunit D [Rhodocyclaceae bacterium]|nr:RnfABCDGE type electron transport complex subunit D [Rhodocyclaceae bacterium]MBX3669587.1 RnfABCDGE type electron transport complex subunit D [Rhodocyclaceae bacterium]
MEQPDLRLAALRRFGTAISVLTLVGHGFLGFEQAPAHVAMALATAYTLELATEWLLARLQNRPARYRGGWRKFIDFMLPGHITGLACAMLLYTNERFWVLAFAVAVAVGSKSLLRVPVGRATLHVLNPSNTGITTTLLLFPWVGIAPPYQFTENIYGIADWLLPLVFVIVGSFLNIRFTRRIVLILGWLGGFALQALARQALFGTPFEAPLAPFTGVAFLLFTFYMVSDPATTPQRPLQQAVFGAAVALVYGALVMLHIVFAMFYALTLVCAARGLLMYLASLKVQVAVPAKAAMLAQRQEPL